ncbi:MAG: DM13 domain-containing protein [Gemmatimonadales bacterium]
MASPLVAQDDSTKMKKDEMMKKDDKMGHDAMGPNPTFMGAGGHKAAGDYEIVDANGRKQIKLKDSFAIKKVPDAYLVLAAGDKPDAKSVYVTKLKSLTGAQAYDLPKGVDLSQFSKVLVWCKKFSVLIASADLASSGEMMHH